MTWGSCGKNLGSWRLVEEVKMMILEKWQKVFLLVWARKLIPLAMRINRMKWHIKVGCSTKFELIRAK